MRRRPRLGLIAALVLSGGALPAVADEARLALVGRYVWDVAALGMGGFSGLEVTSDGTAFLALSDRGYTVSGGFTRAVDGAIEGVADLRGVPLQGPDGERLDDTLTDSEGLAADGMGGFYVSFENVHRIARYAGHEAAGALVPSPPEFFGLPVNSGIEALAITPDGTLHALPEDDGTAAREITVLRYKDGKWRRDLRIPSGGRWHPVGADFGPDDHLYLLERDFWGLIGFKTRIRRLTINGDSVTKDEVLLTTRAGQHDNLEGIAVWQDGTGAIRLTMISDDNYRRAQVTEIVEYRLTD